MDRLIQVSRVLGCNPIQLLGELQSWKEDEPTEDNAMEWVERNL